MLTKNKTIKVSKGGFREGIKVWRVGFELSHLYTSFLLFKLFFNIFIKTY